MNFRFAFPIRISGENMECLGSIPKCRHDDFPFIVLVNKFSLHRFAYVGAAINIPEVS